ncbi:MAG: efflux RND transporter permease subunit [Planctomycetota bacterium]
MKSVITWFAENSVAANLLMAMIVAVGVVSMGRVGVEVLPELDPKIVAVTVAYPGASPDEVEESICSRVEEAVWDVDGVDEITSRAAEGMGSIFVECRTDADAREVLDDVKVRVDAIDTFPDEAEKPIVSEIVVRKKVIEVAISANGDEWALRTLADEIRDELTALDDVSQVDLVNARPYEITLELSEDRLREYELTFDEVAAAVRRSSLNLPGGSVRARSGEILLRAEGQAYRGLEFESVPVRTRADGTRITLGDVAHVVDGFRETDQASRFDGVPSIQLRVFRVGDQSALAVADAVKSYVERKRAGLPEGFSITTWGDESKILRDRLDTLVHNGVQGLLLVFVILALFLRFRLAFWVALGIPIAFMGTLAVLVPLGTSVNMISLFAFILVMGIVVDDAIVVSESIHTHQSKHHEGRAGARRGVLEIAGPVLFAVSTTIVAFLPMAFMDGVLSRLWFMIPSVVIPTLLFSLVESLFVLPSHLAHVPRLMSWISTIPPFSWWVRFQTRFSDWLEGLAHRWYAPVLRLALRWRMATLAVALAFVVTAVGVVANGMLRFEFMPQIEGDNVAAQIEMPPGTPIERTAEVASIVEDAARALQDELRGTDAKVGDGDLIQHYLTALGSQPYRSATQNDGIGGGAAMSGSHLAEITLQLVPAEGRETPADVIERRWRELAKGLPPEAEVTFSAALTGADKDVQVRLRSADEDVLLAASADLQERLAEFPGVYGVTDTYEEGKRELTLGILPAAEQVGLRLSDLARQVRQAYYGEEVQRVQRGRDDVRVMLRFPADDRRDVAALERMYVRAPDGSEVPFSDVATASLARGYSTIQRSDRQRSVDVLADVDTQRQNKEALRQELMSSVLPAIEARHPGVRAGFTGTEQERAEALQQLGRYYVLALIAIFALMAIPFRSYLQPLLVMSAIPFGIVGAIGGHLITGYDLSMLSVLGIIALSGVVVNDSLVLVDYVNKRLREGATLFDAVVSAGTARFRAVILTSLTTFGGLTPLMLERSVQAQFMVPMAVSLAFGVMFATAITLLLVPTLFSLFVRDRAEAEEGRAEGVAPA